jgi:hypothetical protein
MTMNESIVRCLVPTFRQSSQDGDEYQLGIRGIQSIKDAKSELGMSDYQVKTRRAWHHHITLTMLALLFMLQQKLSHHEESPLLSCSDIRFILAHTLLQKVVSKADVLDMIEQRHHRRQYDLDRYAES